MAGLTRLTIHKPSANRSKSPSTSLRQVSILVSSNTPSEILPIESQSFSAQTELEEKFTALEIKERREHKCRGRPDSVGWFESKSHRRLEHPLDDSESTFDGLVEGDLFVNWLSEDLGGLSCQIWIFEKDKGKSGMVWRSMGWGSQRIGSKHRLVITERGTPSFVAESTWKKKYRKMQPRVVP